MEDAIRVGEASGDLSLAFLEHDVVGTSCACGWFGVAVGIAMGSRCWNIAAILAMIASLSCFLSVACCFISSCLSSCRRIISSLC